MKRTSFHLVRWLWLLLACVQEAWAGASSAVVLVYHRFGPVVADSMTTRTQVFEAQITRLRQEGYVFLPLARLVSGLEGREVLPAKALAITVDDGHSTVYSELLPIVRRERLPVALFIYPSAISNASYAMSWDQLKEMQATGLVEIHSHTYWHPNFRQEHRRLSPEAYERFVRMQLEKPRLVLRQKLGVEAEMLAWPFGIHDPDLDLAARAAGYRAAFDLGAKPATPQTPRMALPRYLIVDGHGVKGLMGLMHESARRSTGGQP